MNIRETGLLAVVAVAAVGLLTTVTTACDLSVEPVGVVSDTTDRQGDDPGSTS